MFQACWQSWTPLWAHWAWRRVWAPWSITRDRASTGWGWTAKRWSDQQPAAVAAAGCLQTLRAASRPWAAPQACEKSSLSSLHMNVNSSHVLEDNTLIIALILIFFSHVHVGVSPSLSVSLSGTFMNSGYIWCNPPILWFAPALYLPVLLWADIVKHLGIRALFRSDLNWNWMKIQI